MSKPATGQQNSIQPPRTEPGPPPPPSPSSIPGVLDRATQLDTITRIIASRIPGAQPDRVEVHITEDLPGGGSNSWEGSPRGLARTIQVALDALATAPDLAPYTAPVGARANRNTDPELYRREERRTRTLTPPQVRAIWPAGRAKPVLTATTTGTGPGSVTDWHTGWDCPNGASLFAMIESPGRGRLPAHHGVIYVCPYHQAEAEARISAASHQPRTDPAPPGHRRGPWPCGHITTNGDGGPSLAGALTTLGDRTGGDPCA